jgi:sugar phosphate isomerase/epimerase
MYKLGINYCKSAGLSHKEAFSLFKELGFDNIFSSSKEDGEDICAVSENARNAGLFYECIHASWKGINHIWEKGYDGDETEKMLLGAVEDCRRYSVPTVVMHLSSGENAPCVSDEGRARFDRIVDKAISGGVKIAFENQRKLANLAFVMELYADVENVGFCWDVGHEQCFARGREYMPLFSDKLCFTHIHDNLCEYNGDLHRLPFDGKIDFERVAGHIAKSGYKGTLTLEVMPADKSIYKDIDPVIYYEKAYMAISKIRQMCINAK